MIVPGSHGHHGQAVVLRVVLEGEIDIEGYNRTKRMEAHVKELALKLQIPIVELAQMVIKKELRCNDIDLCIIDDNQLFSIFLLQ